MVKVLFYESVKNHSKCESLEIEFAGTVLDLIHQLGERLGAGFRDYLLEDDTCFFLVNGKSIIRTGGLNTPLGPSDKIEILPIVEAG